MPDALTINGINCFYGDVQVLRDFSLDLRKGEVLCLLGRNGAGKTTALKAIMGLVPAARGSVKIAGREVLQLPSHRIAARGIGYVPQGRRVWPSLSVDEHLRVALRGKNGDWTVDRIYELFPRLHERRRNGGRSGFPR